MRRRSSARRSATSGAARRACTSCLRGPRSCRRSSRCSARASYPTLAQNLTAARALVDKTPPGKDLYGAWFAGIRALAKEPSPAQSAGANLGATTPSFMRTDAFRDLRLDSTIAAFGQLRHNYLLMARTSYDGYGCEIPDGYVEPAPAAYDALIAYAERGQAPAPETDPARWSQVSPHFRRRPGGVRLLR